MSKSRLFSGKIKKLSGDKLTVDRYDYLDISQAEPDLGLPQIDGSILVGTTSGVRTWLTTLTNIALITPTITSATFTGTVVGDLVIQDAVRSRWGMFSQRVYLAGTGTNSFSISGNALEVDGGIGGKNLFISQTAFINTLTINSNISLLCDSIQYLFIFFKLSGVMVLKISYSEPSQSILA